MDNKFNLSTDGKNWKEVKCAAESFVAIGDTNPVKTMTYHGMKHVLVSDDGEIFAFDADNCTMEIGKKYEIKLPEP